MLKTRNRIINFRVTEDEFTRLKDASLEKGARCLSDFARTAILLALEGCYDQSPANERPKEQIQSLVQRLGMVERSLAKLERMMSRLSVDEREQMSVGASV